MMTVIHDRSGGEDIYPSPPFKPIQNSKQLFLVYQDRAYALMSALMSAKTLLNRNLQQGKV